VRLDVSGHAFCDSCMLGIFLGWEMGGVEEVEGDGEEGWFLWCECCIKKREM